MSAERIRPGSAGRREDEPPEEHATLEATPEIEEAPETSGASAGSWVPDAELPEETEAPQSSASAPRRRRAPSSAVTAEASDDDLTVSTVTEEVLGRNFFARLYLGQTRIDFVRRRKMWFSISAAVILAGVISLSTRGLNLGIEFVGGTSWTVPSTTLTTSAVQDGVAKYISGETITVLGTNSSRTIEVQAKLPKGQSAETSTRISNDVAGELASLAHSSVSEVSIESVGPSWGGQITHKAIEALIVFFVMIALYISLFFEWRMAFAAIIAVLHDILVTVGIYSLSGFEVTPDTVVAFLTILGYSLYDTIVVFDRVRDNTRHLSVRDRLTYSDVVNLSMNQTLARSINTSLVAIMPILAVLVLGAEVLGASTLQYFGLALLVGLATGAYSSIFIASPLVAVMKEREPRYRQLRERLVARGGDRVLLSASDIAHGAFGESPSRREAAPEGGSSSARRRSAPAGRGAQAARRSSSRSRRKGGRR
jgi:preprotein translocase subunit SecF